MALESSHHSMWSHLVLERIYSFGQYRDSLVTLFCSGNPDTGCSEEFNQTTLYSFPLFLSDLNSNNNQNFPIHTALQNLWKTWFPWISTGCTFHWTQLELLVIIYPLNFTCLELCCANQPAYKRVRMTLGIGKCWDFYTVWSWKKLLIIYRASINVYEQNKVIQ